VSDHIEQTILSLRKKIADHEAAITKVKVTINQLLELEGRQPMYTDADLQQKPSILQHIRKDQFFGKPLATCVRMILDARGAANQGGATTEEIHAILSEGGYAFGPGNELRNVGITLGKNMLFQRTPNGLWGLREWYSPGKKERAPKPLRDAMGTLAALAQGEVLVAPTPEENAADLNAMLMDDDSPATEGK
jgi:hypothetical protein